MPKIKVIRHLYSRAGGPLPSLPTLAKAIGISESIVATLKEAINSEGIYRISPRQGGGLAISGGLENEAATYNHISQQAEDWIKNNIYTTHGETRILGNPTHKKKLGGKWSTPDFSYLCVHKFLHSTNNAVDIVTIEAKHAIKQFEVSCVYEALAHTRASHYSILFFYDDPVNSITDRGAGEILNEIKFECARLGIGLITSAYPCDSATWQYLIPAKRHTPDARRLDAFIEEAFDSEAKNWLKKA